MTDKELDELEQLTWEERAHLLARKDTFVLSSHHMDIITSELFDDTDEGNIKLAKVIRDLVSYCVDGTTNLLDNKDESDPSDRTARRLLYDDCVLYTNKWLLTSLHNSQNRRGKAKDTQDIQTEDQEVKDRPSLDDVIEHAKLCLGGISPSDQEDVARKWYSSVTKNHWLDDKGSPIRNWRKTFEVYADKTWKKKATDRL